VAETPAVPALRVPIGRVWALDRSRAGKEADREAQRWDVSVVDRDDDGGGCLAFPRLYILVKISGGEDPNVLGVDDRLRKAGEMFRVLFW